jgi:hypothetical protein
MAPDLIPRTPASRFRIVRIALVLAALLALPSAGVSAAPRDSDWKLSKQASKGGQPYELYQREVDDSGYDRYRLEAIVDEPMERVIQAITIRREDDRYLGEGLQRTVLRREGPDSVTYLTMRFPLVQDRDVTLRTTRSFDPESGIYRDEWWTANEEAPPLRDGVVRMTKSEGFWEVSRAGESRTRVIYESHADPGGRVPSWIANSIFGDQVIGQIVTLRQIIDEHRSDVDVASPPPSVGAAALMHSLAP